MTHPTLFNLHSPPREAEKMPGMVNAIRKAMGTSDGRFTSHDNYREITQAPVRRDAVDTSREASTAAAGSAKTNERLALHQITLAGEHGRTFDELATFNDWDSSQSGRCTALRDAGLIVDSGRRRKTRKGVSAVVWVAVEGSGA